MNLQEFIEQTLLQIAKASKNVSEEMRANELGPGVKDNDKIMVSFDLAVTINNESTNGVNGGIRVLEAIVFGGSKSDSSKSENVSRIKLELPLQVNGAKTPKYASA
jgi:hypothetical protein